MIISSSRMPLIYLPMTLAIMPIAAMLTTRIAAATPHILHSDRPKRLLRRGSAGTGSDGSNVSFTQVICSQGEVSIDGEALAWAPESGPVCRPES